MVYILIFVLMLQSEGSDPNQHVITTQWTSRSDCEDEETEVVTEADKDPAVVGWFVTPESCEGFSIPRKE